MVRKIKAGSPEFDEYMRTQEQDWQELLSQVQDIGRQVRQRGDEALLDYTARFDGVVLRAEELAVTPEEISQALSQVDDGFLSSLRVAKERIWDFHQKQMRTSWIEADEEGNILGQLHRPLDRVGIYVPGGTAAYPSSVLMNAIPAQVAGVREIIMVTPCSGEGKVNPYTLVAAHELGITKIFKVGGAQAVFALAYGTTTIPKVDKITGPGNIYVTLAKKMVYGEVDIDMLAGPSEILVIADEEADPAYVAADLMSQAEHDVRARAILVTPSEVLCERVREEIERQLKTLTRSSIITESLVRYGAFILTEDLEQAFEVANRIAPEHLEVMVRDPFRYLGRIKHAGAVFLGEYSPEPVGDYLAGPNHILPTGGTARFYSPVTVDTFIKKSSLIYFSRKGLERYGKELLTLAEIEGLTAHANAVRIRKLT